MAKTKKSSSGSSVRLPRKKVSEAAKNNAEEDVSDSTKSSPPEVKKKIADTLALDKTQQKKVSKQTKKIKKGLKDGSITLKANRKELKKKIEESRGLIYIGHIPHGFFEDEMRNYFKQFGKITNLKVCRSKVTGNSKGYGYVEFEHPEVAKIAAESMNNYVMFKKRIVTEYVPYEKRPKRLFQGKSSNLKHTSVKTRQGKQKYSKNKIRDEKTVEKKTKRTYKKLQSKIGKLKNLGIQCNLIPVGLSDKLQQQIKLEEKSRTNVASRQHSQLLKSSTKTAKSSLNNSSTTTALTKLKSKKAILTKSLDSVRALLDKNSTNLQDVETQTPKLRAPKKEKLKGGIVKANKKKNPLTLNSGTVKKIARELIRKRGNPLINLTTNKPKRVTKKK